MANSSISELSNSVNVEVHSELEAQFVERADAFIAMASQVAIVSQEIPDIRAQQEAVDNLALVSMALYELETAETGGKASFYPQWMRAAQVRLDAHTADDPDSQELVHETIFFEPSGKYAREFNSQMYGRRIEPHKTRQLSPQQFAKGVLEGTVTLKA